MESLKVPQDSIALLNMNRMMMHQPDLLYDEMELMVRVVYNDDRVRSSRYSVKDTEGYEVFRRFMIQKDNSDIEQTIFQTSLLLSYILNFLNNDNKTTNMSFNDTTLFKFGFGVNNQYYDIDDRTIAENKAFEQELNLTVATTLLYITNSRGFLKLDTLHPTIKRVELSVHS